MPVPVPAALLADALPAGFYEALFVVAFLIALVVAAILSDD